MYFDKKIKKSKGLIEVNQNDVIMSPKIETSQETIGKILKERFARLHERQKMGIIKNTLHNLYGRHNAIPYKPQFNFHQRWQQMTEPNCFDGGYSLIKAENSIFTIFYITVIILYVLTIWFLTVYRLFNTTTIFYPFLGLTFITQLIDAVFKAILNSQSEDNTSKSKIDFKQQLQLHWIGLLFLPFFCFLIIENEFSTMNKQLFIFPIDLVFVWLCYSRYSDIYSLLKIKVLASKYRNQVQILQLMGRCITLVHIFSLFLYIVSLVNKQTNWTNSVDIFNEDWLHRYGYSLYFSCTTTFTIGYGDITPKNILQIFTIMLVQMLGVINFGFIINEIGRIMAKISQSQQLLYKNISQAEKLAENYKLPETLVRQMRTYIINNQIATAELNIEEEDNFMRKLNDEIREDVRTLNHLRIIKSSVFFLCHWSKKFQRAIANKLIRAVYSPQETLHQIKGKEKIYIVAKGKVDIEACLNSNSYFRMRKPLKTIEFCPDKQVQFNVYGYSTLISGLNINLRAVVKDYSICYVLSKQDITSTMIQDDQDFEYYHQIKKKIQQSSIKQLWQAPSISNTREHYLPNNFYILKKNKFHYRESQNRRDHLRSEKKTKCYIQSDIQTSQPEIQSDDSLSESLKHVPEVPEIMLLKVSNVLSTEERKMKYDSQSKCMITNRPYKQKVFRQRSLDENERAKQDKETIVNKLDCIKKFKRYNQRHNGVDLIEYYNRRFCKLTEADKSTISMKFETKMFEAFSEDVLQKIIRSKRIGCQKVEE